MLHRRALLALPLLAAPAAAQHAFLPDGQALSLLRAGGLNLYIRHAITDRTQVDTGRRGDRAGQRNLSEAGRQQARALGAAFRALNIPVAEVLTSEVFRAADTAELAFGQARVERDLIADDYTPGDAWEDARAVSRRLAQPSRPAPGRVSHDADHRTPRPARRRSSIRSSPSRSTSRRFSAPGTCCAT